MFLLFIIVLLGWLYKESYVYLLVNGKEDKCWERSCLFFSTWPTLLLIVLLVILDQLWPTIVAQGKYIEWLFQTFFAVGLAAILTHVILLPWKMYGIVIFNTLNNHHPKSERQQVLLFEDERCFKGGKKKEIQAALKRFRGGAH